MLLRYALLLYFLFFRFCVALEEMDNDDNPISLVLGCSNAQTVRKRATIMTAVPVVITRAPDVLRIDNLR